MNELVTDLYNRLHRSNAIQPWVQILQNNSQLALTLAIGALSALTFIQDAHLSLFLYPGIPKNAYKGQVIWIVGASSGIGESLAKDCVKAGAKVIISARRVENLNAIADECAKYGERPFVVPFDLTDFNKHIEVYNEVIKKYGKVDILVLNSGIAQSSEALETPIEVTEDLMKLNFLSFVAFNKVVMPDMVKQKSGKVVVVSSILGIIPYSIGSSYSASKFALQGYFGALRGEISTDNVKVAIVNPGPISTDILSKAYGNDASTLKKMPSSMEVSRCSSLILKGLYYNFEDLWISKQPFLFLTTLAQYLPGVTRWLITNFMGPSQVQELRSRKSL